MAYERTEVTAAKSQDQIRTLLRKYGATRSSFAEDFSEEHASVGAEFVYADTLVRMFAPLGRTGDQEVRRLWRLLHWAIKVRMEAVEEGLETFEQAFLAHLVDPSTQVTLWDSLQGKVESGALKLSGPGLPALTAGGS